MRPSHNAFRIGYSRFLSVPLLGSGIYCLATTLVASGRLSHMAVSHKDSPLRRRFLSTIGRTHKTLIVSDPFLGRTLASLTCRTVLDAPDVRVGELSIRHLYDLMWTLVFVSAITPATHRALRGFVASDFPVEAMEGYT